MIEMLVGLHVTNDAAYQAYRDGMAPILERCRGGFGYDFQIAKVLKQATEAPINRVFTIYFRDETNRDEFFSDPEYKRIKQEFFEQAVSHTTILASYVRAEM